MTEKPGEDSLRKGEQPLKKQDNEDEKERYAHQTSKLQINFLTSIVAVVILSGTGLMLISLFTPSFTINSLRVANQTNPTAVDAALSSGPKDVLPFATGLIGFAGGLVTAVYGKITQVGKDEQTKS